MEGLLETPAGAGLRGLVATASGNPLYVAELLAALSREGAIRAADGVAEATGYIADADGGWVPKSLVEVILQRLDFLPRKARETLEIRHRTRR